MLAWFWLYYILANVAFLVFLVFAAHTIVGYLHYRKEQRQQPPTVIFDIETYYTPMWYYTEVTGGGEKWEKMQRNVDK